MPRTATVAAFSAALLLGLGGLAACGSNQDASSTAATPKATPSSSAPATPTPSPSAGAKATPKATTARLTIKDYAFSGLTKVAAGATVTVRNDDSEAHTVTADTGGAFDVAIPPGATKTFTAPRKAGTYKYHCTYHANMHGSLTVG